MVACVGPRSGQKSTIRSPTLTPGGTLTDRARFPSPPAVLWSITGTATQHSGRLESLQRRRARLLTDATPAVGDELRIELQGPAGAPIALGLARVAVSGRGVMEVELVALGVDPGLLAALTASLAPGLAVDGPSAAASGPSADARDGRPAAPADARGASAAAFIEASADAGDAGRSSADARASEARLSPDGAPVAPRRRSRPRSSRSRSRARG